MFKDIALKDLIVVSFTDQFLIGIKGAPPILAVTDETDFFSRTELDHDPICEWAYDPIAYTIQTEPYFKEWFNAVWNNIPETKNKITPLGDVHA